MELLVIFTLSIIFFVVAQALFSRIRTFRNSGMINLYRMPKFPKTTEKVINTVSRPKLIKRLSSVTWREPPGSISKRDRIVKKIKSLSEHHKVESIMKDMIQKDGAGT